LNDEDKRRAYDLIYPSIQRSKAKPETTYTQTPRPHAASAPRPEANDEVAQIAALRKAKDERNAKWRITKNALESPIFELQRTIRRLEQDIKNLTSIEAAERAAEASKNSWGTWILSPLYKKIEESEEEKARKDRERQERRIQKDMKERRLGSEKSELFKREDQMKEAKNKVDAENLHNDQSIENLEARKRLREERERRLKEWEEQERLAKIRREQAEQQAKVWKQQQEQREKAAQKAREDSMRAQAEARAAAARQEELRRNLRNDLHSRFASSSTGPSYSSACDHGGWWDKVHQRTPCPRCHDVWPYLLQCPGCQTKACPKCQSDMRPRFPRHHGRTSQRTTRRPKSPSPDRYNYDADWFD
jgi:hypothetical protein